MNTAVAALRPRPYVRSLAPAKASERSLERRVTWAWGLLVLNVLTFDPGVSILHIPSSLGKMITQGSLTLSLLLILTVNRKLIIRPNVFLCLPSLLVIEAILTCLEAQYLKGTAYRTFRLAEFVARAVAAHAVLGPPRPAARPLPPEGDDGRARLGGPSAT